MQALRDLPARVSGVEARLDGVEVRLSGVEVRLGTLELQFVQLRSEMHDGFSAMRAEITAGTARPGTTCA
jgi:hypothetical protein